MDQIIGKMKGIQEILLIFISVLLVSFHYSFVYFINSTYLNGIFGAQFVGYLYMAGALLNILFFLGAPYFLIKKGNFKMSLLFIIMEALSLIGLAFATDKNLIIWLFILHIGVSTMLFYTIDIFLEKYEKNEERGSMRGIYLTMQNLPPIIAPFIAGLILIKSNYWIIYLIAAAFLVPVTLILFSYFKQYQDQRYYVLNVKQAAESFYKKQNIFDVFVDRILLNLFYAITVIYLPIYLIDYIGFNWGSIGIIFSIMLLPFIIFQIPIGNLEDKFHDEKYMLIVGFFLMAGTFIVIPFIQEASLVLWSSILFLSRIGASIVEVSSESYFFKHIHPDNAGFIGFFRMTKSLPYFLSPLLLTLAVLTFGFKYVFLITGVIMLIGVRYTLNITDDLKEKRNRIDSHSEFRKETDTVHKTDQSIPVTGIDLNQG